MQINQVLVDAGLASATEKIATYFPHLEIVAGTNAKVFANAACQLAAVEGVTVKEYWRLASIAAGRY